MKAIDKSRLETLLRRVIGRPENIPSPPAPRSDRPAVLRTVDSPYRCEPTRWGVDPVIAAPPAHGRSPAGPARGGTVAPAPRRRGDLEPRPAPPPRGLLT